MADHAAPSPSRRPGISPEVTRVLWLRVTAVVLVAGSLWSEVARAQSPRPEDVELSALAGGVVSLATEAEVGVSPLMALEVATPLSSWEMTPRLRVRLKLTDLPGETVVLQDPRSYRAVEASMTICQPIDDSIYIDLCLEAGFASRLPTDPGPLNKAARWGAGLARFGRTGRGWLTVGLARDQRLDGLYRWTAVVAGAVKMAEAFGVEAQVVGDAILGIETGPNASRRDLVRVGLAVGVGR